MYTYTYIHTCSVQLWTDFLFNCFTACFAWRRLPAPPHQPQLGPELPSSPTVVSSTHTHLSPASSGQCQRETCLRIQSLFSGLLHVPGVGPAIPEVCCWPCVQDGPGQQHPREKVVCCSHLGSRAQLGSTTPGRVSPTLLASPWPCLPPASYLKIFFGGGVQLERCFKELNGVFGGDGV